MVPSYSFSFGYVNISVGIRIGFYPGVEELHPGLVTPSGTKGTNGGDRGVMMHQGRTRGTNTSSQERLVDHLLPYDNYFGVYVATQSEANERAQSSQT